MSNAAKRRQQGKPRSPKKGAKPNVQSGTVAAPAQPAPQLSTRAEAFRARRGGAAVPTSGFVLSREQEMAYIRDDLRRLVYISGALLVLMLVILYIIER